MVDLPFSRPFYQWLLREEGTFSSRDLLDIDPTIANTVSQLEGIVRKKRRLEEDTDITPGKLPFPYSMNYLSCHAHNTLPSTSQASAASSSSP